MKTVHAFFFFFPVGDVITALLETLEVQTIAHRKSVRNATVKISFMLARVEFFSISGEKIRGPAYMEENTSGRRYFQPHSSPASTWQRSSDPKQRKGIHCLQKEDSLSVSGGNMDVFASTSANTLKSQNCLKTQEQVLQFLDWTAWLCMLRYLSGTLFWPLVLYHKQKPLFQWEIYPKPSSLWACFRWLQ